MRLLSFQVGGKVSFGAIVEHRVVDLAERMPEYHSLRELLRRDAIVRAQDITAEASADYAIDEIDYLPTIPDPQKIICVDRNYLTDDNGQGDSKTAAADPVITLRTRESVVGHKQPIIRPPESNQFDYEAEIAIVIGKPGRRIPTEQARQHIAGLTLMNDGTMRDWIKPGSASAAPAKNFERSGAMGPCLVTLDEFANLDELILNCSVNRALRQETSSANLVFGFEHLVSYLSTFMHLQPGDVIATGSPAGTGVDMDPPEYLTHGDVVEVQVDPIGRLRNSVEDESLEEQE